MAKPASFLAMRGALVERGLVDGEFRLTAAGQAYVDKLIERLMDAPDPTPPRKPPVIWNYNRRVFREAAARRSEPARG